ncbi:MAG TPA: hypothetical protein VM864_00105 [Pyrinomonadaceae bacterium]|jgi:hypothetical protein|nr:hypothetical protein [Pyrinomonadaceae bacterium]
MLLFVGPATCVQAQSDACNVTTYWVEEGGGSTSRFNVGAFNVSPTDERITKSFKHQESGLTIRVGVEYFEESPERRVRLAIAFTGEPESIFEEFERAEAETFRGKGWTGMSVSKTSKWVTVNTPIRYPAKKTGGRTSAL